MKTGSEQYPLSDEQIALFARSFGAIAWTSYTNPMWPGAKSLDQCVRLLYARGAELRTVEFRKPLFSVSTQLVETPGTAAVTSQSDFHTLYGHNTIHYLNGGST